MNAHHQLQSRIFQVKEIDAALREPMFRLFASYYDGADRHDFDRDLNEKNEVVTVWCDAELCGFTTLQWSLFLHDDREIAVLYSGDTIMDRQYWGHQTLATAWLRRVGYWSLRRPACPLFYWLLIVKGHRTFRYMSAFGIDFVPTWVAGPNSQSLLRLRNTLARHRFGAAFNERDGVVRYAGTKCRLRPEIARPTERERQRPDVAFFLESNPGYIDGDELVCLCPLSPSNMKSFGRRLLEQGEGSSALRLASS